MRAKTEAKATPLTARKVVRKPTERVYQRRMVLMKPGTTELEDEKKNE